MNGFKVDLHMHSCLSPCADDDMTPVSMAGMAALNEIRIAALTDHNASGNCPAFFEACEAYGVIPVAGMELTTSEDVHMVCLFPELASALSFEREIQPHRLPLKNKPLIFGNQYIMDTEDRILGEEPFFLPAATDIGIPEAVELVRSFGGVCYPAHIDRDANGLIAMLGAFPPEPVFPVAELRDKNNMALAGGRKTVASSDAHHLLDIGENDFILPLDAAYEDRDGVIKALFRYLNGD